MKLVIILSIAALVACDYSAPEQEAILSNAYLGADKTETSAGKIPSPEPGKTFFSFKNYYQEAFPPARYSSPYFPSFSYPYKAFNYASSPQGILPPISQIIPPQISQIVPPISQIIPPIFESAKPALSMPSPIFPPQIFPSQILPPLSKPLLNKFTFPYYSPSYQFSYAFPPSFFFPSTSFFSSQSLKQPAKSKPESLSTSYGPPAETPVDPEPAGPVENSAPFEQSPVSFPYEPTAPEAQEPAAPHKPAQEYGLPTKK